MQSTDEFEFMSGQASGGYLQAGWMYVTDTKIEQGFFINSALPTAAAAGTSVKQFKDIAGKANESGLCYEDEFTRSSGALASSSKTACPAQYTLASNAAGYKFPTSGANAISIGTLNTVQRNQAYFDAFKAGQKDPQTSQIGLSMKFVDSGSTKVQRAASSLTFFAGSGASAMAAASVLIAMTAALL